MLKSPAAFVGNLTHDPISETTQNGTPYSRLRVAVSETVRTDDGWAKTDAVFINVHAFGRTARAAAQTFLKGDRVAVIGRIEIETYIGKDGDRRTGTKAIADVIAADPLFTPITIERTRRAPEPAAAVDPHTEVASSAPLADQARAQWAAAEQQNGIGR